MTDVARLLSLSYGLNASATTIGTAPASFATVLPRAAVPSFLPRTRQAIDRALYSVDGRRFMRVFGVKDIAELQLPVEFKGISGNTGAGITSAGGWELVMEQGNLLASLFGSTAATTTVGAAPTVTSGTGSSLTVSTNVLANLDIILVQTSIGTEARQVVSGGGTTTVTVDRAWIGTPTASSAVIRAARYSVSTSQTVHTPVWFNAEGENWRRRYADCQPSSLVLNVPNAGLVEADFAFLPNDWDDQAEANPSFAAPTAGSPVVSGGSQFFIGANAFMLRSARLTVNIGMVMRETTTGINGVRGGLATDKTNIMLEGELYVGDNAGVIGDVSDDTGGAGVSPFLNDILGDGSATGAAPSSVDVSLQVGTAAGAAMFLRIPAADFRSAGVREGGPFAVLPFQAFATAPASGSPFSLGVF
jgi:hypothetical protein